VLLCCQTGNPKGAILKHVNLVSAVGGVNSLMPPEFLSETDIALSYLPAAHIYERSVDLTSIDCGRALGFSQGDNTKLAEDVAELKPTLFPGVPRVWQRMYDRINAQVSGSNLIARQMFQRGLAAKTDAIAHGISDQTLWDRLVFSKVAARFGGRLKVLISGAAPISATVAEFIHIAFQAPMLEGYGLTETCATLTLGVLDCPNMGRDVGIPLPCNEVKLVDVPDMGYLTTDQPHPRGEIWVRGFNVFSGYFKLPEVTAECLTPDGWFQTGDVGQWQPNGSLKIIDRKKVRLTASEQTAPPSRAAAHSVASRCLSCPCQNLFKLSQGEYIRPEHIEGAYKQCKSDGDRSSAPRRLFSISWLTVSWAACLSLCCQVHRQHLRARRQPAELPRGSGRAELGDAAGGREEPAGAAARQEDRARRAAGDGRARTAGGPEGLRARAAHPAGGAGLYGGERAAHAHAQG
jgi:long-chain acyl-CoA synthetase